MQPQYEINLSNIAGIKEKLNKLINNNINVLVNDGSANNPRYQKYSGKLTLVSNNIFAIEQDIGFNHTITKTFMINGILINRIKIEQ